MSVGILALVSLAALLAAIFLGLPVAFCLFGVSMLIGLMYLGPGFLFTAFNALWGQSTYDIYIAIPLFIFMASMLEFSRIGEDIFDVMYKLFGSLRGGLAIGTVLADAVMAAMTGLGGTATVIMGMIALPQMKKHNYSKSISLGCISAGGALGPLIPPSIIMIVLGGLTSLSVGKLFVGGLLPGILMASLFCSYIGLRCYINPSLAQALRPEELVPLREKIISLYKIIAPILIVVLVLGGIYTGANTPTEAAGIGALAIFFCTVARRRATWANIKKAVFSTARINAMVMWLLIGGSSFASLMGASGVRSCIADTILISELSPMFTIIIMMLIGMLLGMFMDCTAVSMICIPVFMPVVRAIGADPLWFTLLFTINMVLGYISPPFGMNLFYLKGVASEDVTILDIYKSAVPFCLIMILTLALVLVFPQIATWLPSKMR